MPDRRLLESRKADRMAEAEAPSSVIGVDKNFSKDETLDAGDRRSSALRLADETSLMGDEFRVGTLVKLVSTRAVGAVCLDTARRYQIQDKLGQRVEERQRKLRARLTLLFELP